MQIAASTTLSMILVPEPGCGRLQVDTDEKLLAPQMKHKSTPVSITREKLNGLGAQVDAWRRETMAWRN
jgi:hypothetical protein